jgi:hypothetical protein
MMDVKIAILACFISFLFGTTSVIMWNKVREARAEAKAEAVVKKCAVHSKKGNEMHVWVGDYK